MIIGLTDRPTIRRDGKIRCGTGPKSGGFKNTDHFLMRDCPQLVPILGETPKEIYFTFHTDNPAEIAKIDLRWYNSTELLCQSMHNTQNPNQPIGQWAAYRGVQDAEGVTQEPYPGIARTRKRQCNYKTCRNFMTNECSEHLFLNVMIPQYSMSSIFTVDSTSMEAILNVLGLFEKVGTQFGGKYSGEIYRMYKKKIKATFFDTKRGQTAKSEPLVLAFEHVPYDQYLERFGNSIPKENLAALERLRSQQGLRNISFYAGATMAALAAPPVAVAEIGFDGMELDQKESQGYSDVPTLPQKSDEDALRERANHTALMPLFEELSNLVGVKNTEDNRIKTAKAIKSTEELVIYLKKKISEARARSKVEVTPEPAAMPPESFAAPQDLSESPLF